MSVLVPKLEKANKNWAKNISRKKVESVAERVIDLTGFIPGEMGIEHVVNFFEGNIHYKDLSQEQADSGSMTVRGFQNFDICISDTSSELRDNFTIAHEIGHYILHSDLGDRPGLFTRYGSNRLEWEANWFAAALLMPKKELKKIAKEVDSSNIKLAAHFNVSEMAIEVRREVLSI